MSTLFPQAHIIGVDVAFSSLPNPLPTTCLFTHANILHGLPFPDQQFSFTHQRLLVAAIPVAQWPGVVRELVRVTRPGGWIELLEIGDTIQNAGTATKRLLTWMTDISRGFGFEMEVLHHLGDLLKSAGCRSVESQDIPVPLGNWAGNTGQMMLTDVLHGYNALKDSYCPRRRHPQKYLMQWFRQPSKSGSALTHRMSSMQHMGGGRLNDEHHVTPFSRPQTG